MANKFENYTVQEISRLEIHKAEYNPRVITEAARKKLKKAIKEHGLVMPIVMNRRTGNVVGGHQRIDVLDELHKGEDYRLNVAMVDIDEEEEVKLNILLNNPSVQGEWDLDLLTDIKLSFPEIDFINDLGFEKVDLDYMFSTTDKMQGLEGIFKETEEQKAIVTDIEAIKQAKKEHREKVKQQNAEGVTHNVENDDFYLTLVFNNNSEKHQLLMKNHKNPNEKFISASVLYDIASGKFKL